MAICAAQEALTIAHAAVAVGPVVEVGVDVVEGAIQLHALESRAESGPFRFALQASTAYDGIAVAATVC